MSDLQPIKTISVKEKEQLSKEFQQNLDFANSLTEEQINFICDAGYYNDAIKGYVLRAATEANFTKEQIRALLSGLVTAFDYMNKEEADKYYTDFH